MIIDSPRPGQLPELRQLWQQVFGDTDAFLDGFFSTGFSPRRCRCITENGRVTAALYWFDCEFCGTPVAYLYAVATAEGCRGKGLCHRLMENTHAHLASLGYRGTILVPAHKSLFDFYGRMGYAQFNSLLEFPCSAGSAPEPLRKLSPEEYGQLRKKMLPTGGVLQEGASLTFLNTYADFYAGENLLLAAVPDGENVFVPELLGDATRAAGIVNALGKKTGIFRTPGDTHPFAMYRGLTSAPPAKGYFGLALD